jgi:hypothetical protein
MVDKLLLSRSGNYSMRVQVPLPLNSLNFNIFGLNLSEPGLAWSLKILKSK